MLRLSILTPLALLVAIAWSGGCNDEPLYRSATGLTTIGAPCETLEDCENADAVCVHSLPGGYCTLPCAAQGCPSGTACAQLDDMAVCAVTCSSDNACRNGYQCNIPAGQQLGICDARSSGSGNDADVGRGGDADQGGDRPEQDAGDRDAMPDLPDAPPLPLDTSDDDTTPPQDIGSGDDTTPPEDTGTGDDDTTPPEDTGDTPHPERTPGTTCEANGDCPDGGQCNWMGTTKACTYSCTSDDDCGPGNTCQSMMGRGSCIRNCESAGDCYEGQQCCNLFGASICQSSCLF